MNGEETASTAKPESNIVTIPAGSDALSSEIKSLTTGAMVNIVGRISANDENGLSLEIQSIEKAPDSEEPTGEEPAAEAPAAESETETPTGAADDYVSKRRRMAEMA